MKVTVIIPTRNRPDTLRTALESVFVQDVSIIKRVVVSDNSDNNESKAVVEEFRSSLVRYEKTTHPIFDPIERARQCYGFADAEYFALLHDDDWWHPGHLRQSVEQLERVPDALLSGSSFLRWKWSPCRSGQRVEFVGGELLLSLCEASIEKSVVACEPAEIFAFCLMGGYFHYSTLVLRRSFLDHLEELLRPELYQFDTDRLLLAVAARRGRVLYLTAPSATIRLHVGSDSSQRLHVAKAAAAKVSDSIIQGLDERCMEEVVTLIEKTAKKCKADPTSKLAKHIILMSAWFTPPATFLIKCPRYRKFLQAGGSRWHRWSQRIAGWLRPGA